MKIIQNSSNTTTALIEVWFTQNQNGNPTDSNVPAIVYSIHQSSDSNYPYYRSLIEYNTFEYGTLPTENNISSNNPDERDLNQRYIGESANINGITLTKIIFPSFLRKLGYKYAYVYSKLPDMSDYPNWYTQSHFNNGEVPYRAGLAYEMTLDPNFEEDGSDVVEGEDQDSNKDPVSSDIYDIIIQITSNLSKDMDGTQVIQCIHTSNFSKPHLSQISRISTQENYGNVLSTNTFLSLAGTMNAFVLGNMLVAEDFSMRYIGDQLLLASPTGIQVTFYSTTTDTPAPQSITDGSCEVNMAYPGTYGYFVSQILPSNSCISASDVCVYAKSCCTCSDYEPLTDKNCITIECSRNNTEYRFILAEDYTPYSLCIDFSIPGQDNNRVCSLIMYQTQQADYYCFQPSSSTRALKVGCGYTLYDQFSQHNLLSEGTNSNDDIIICPSDATPKKLAWCVCGYDDISCICILGGQLDNSQNCINKNFVWVNNNLYTLQKPDQQVQEEQAQEEEPSTVCCWVYNNNYLYSSTDCFGSSISLYQNIEDITTCCNPVIGYSRTTTFIPKDYSECSVGCDGYLESYCVNADLVQGEPWGDEGYYNLNFTYAPTCVCPVNSCIYINDLWPGCCTCLEWRTAPYITCCNECCTYICSLTYCENRRATVTEIQCSNEGFGTIESGDQYANYIINGTICEGEWKDFADRSTWECLTRCGTLCIALNDYPELNSCVEYGLASCFCSYYASLKIQPTGEGPLPSPYLLYGNTLQLSGDLKLVCCPGDANSDVIQYCSGSTLICPSGNGWSKEAPTAGTTSIEPVDIWVQSCCHCDIYSNHISVLPVYPVTSACICGSGEIGECTCIYLCRGCWAENTQVGGYSVVTCYNDGDLYYINIFKPFTPPQIPGTDCYGIQLDCLISYEPVYACHIDADSCYITGRFDLDRCFDSTAPLTCGLTLSTDNDKHYLIIDNEANLEDGTSGIEVCTKNTETGEYLSNPIYFYINVEQYPENTPTNTQEEVEQSSPEQESDQTEVQEGVENG